MGLSVGAQKLNQFNLKLSLSLQKSLSFLMSLSLNVSLSLQCNIKNVFVFVNAFVIVNVLVFISELSLLNMPVLRNKILQTLQSEFGGGGVNFFNLIFFLNFAYISIGIWGSQLFKLCQDETICINANSRSAIKVSFWFH